MKTFPSKRAFHEAHSLLLPVVRLVCNTLRLCKEADASPARNCLPAKFAGSASVYGQARETLRVIVRDAYNFDFTTGPEPLEFEGFDFETELIDYLLARLVYRPAPPALTRAERKARKKAAMGQSGRRGLDCVLLHRAVVQLHAEGTFRKMHPWQVLPTAKIFAGMLGVFRPPLPGRDYAGEQMRARFHRRPAGQS